MAQLIEYSPRKEIRKRVAQEKANASQYDKFILLETVSGLYIAGLGGREKNTLMVTEDVDLAETFTTYDAAEVQAELYRTRFHTNKDLLIVIHSPELDTPEE